MDRSDPALRVAADGPEASHPGPSAGERRAAWRKILAYCLLVPVLSLPGYYLGVHKSGLTGRQAAAVLMWGGPAPSAIIVRLATQRNLRGIGFQIGDPKWLAFALLLPFAYALPPYLAAWGTGMAAFVPTRWETVLPYGLHPHGVLMALGLIFTVGLFDKVSRALGEEIGWRGLLVPELLKVVSFRTTALASGTIWALWHFPLILLADYNAAGTPVGFQLACFFIMVASSGFFYAWLRMRSNSVWPAALLHGAHNLLIQSVLDQSTVDRGGALWLTSEFGAGIAVCIVGIVGLTLWRTKTEGRANPPYPGLPVRPA